MLRPMPVFSSSSHFFLEEGVQAAHRHKMMKYSVLAAECREGVLTTVFYLVEVGFYTADT